MSRTANARSVSSDHWQSPRLQLLRADALDFRGGARRRHAQRSGRTISRQSVRSPMMPRHTSNEDGIRQPRAAAPPSRSWRRWLLVACLISLAVFCRNSLFVNVASAALAGDRLAVASSPSDTPSHSDDRAAKSSPLSPSGPRSRVAWARQPSGDAPLPTSWSRSALADGAPDSLYAPGVLRAFLQVFRI